MGKTSSEHRTTRSATAAAKASVKPSNKPDMATALVKEERQPVHELVHTESEQSDEEEHKLATQLRSLERKKCIAEMSARSRTLTAELANLSLHAPTQMETASNGGDGRQSRDVSSERRRCGRSMSKDRPGHWHHCNR